MHHKNEENKDLYCGKEGWEWGVAVIFVTIFYLCLGGMAVGCFELFKVIILDKHGNLPYRTAHQYANDKFLGDKNNDEMQPDVLKLKNKVDETLWRPMITSSLDFPFLSTSPRRFKGSDDLPGDERDTEYYKIKDGHIKRVRRALKEKEGVARFVECGDDFIGEITDKKKDNWGKKVCRERKDEIEKLVGVCQHFSNFTISAEATNNLKVCLYIKMNKIVGFIPKLYRDDATLKEQCKHMQKYTPKNDKATPKFLPEPDECQNVKNKLPVVCWAWTNEKNNTKTEEFKKFKFGFPVTTEDKVEESKEELSAKGFYDLRDFPYMNQPGNPGAFIPLVLDYSGTSLEIIIDVKIHIECRAMAANIPYDYKVDLLTTSRHGHTSFVAKIYKDGSDFYWKMDKDKEI